MIDTPTLAHLTGLAARAFGERTALRFKRDGTWHTLDYTGLAEAVDRLAAGLVRLGVRPGEHVGLLAETSADWTLCDLAIARAGAVSIPVYPTGSPEECAFVLEHARVRTVLADTPARADAAARATGVDTVVLFHPAATPSSGSSAAPAHRSLADLRAPLTAADRDRLDGLARTVDPSATATVIYTSGTTGRPKGCMITHANLRASCRATAALMDDLGEDEEIYLHLPLAHIMSRSIQLAALAHGAALVYFGGDIRAVIGELAEARPTVLPSAPRLFEKTYAAVRDLPPEQVARAVGGRLRMAATGAAPIAPEILDFFDSCGIPVLDTYGMTESSALMAANRLRERRHGTVGRPMPGVELRIADDGEILTRGPGVFAGYLDDPEATAETVVDGWLHTGDLGAFDEDGFLTVTGRKKDLIITSAGKNIAPAALENLLRRSPYVSQAVLTGDRRPHAAVLVTLDQDTVTAWATARGIAAPFPELARHPAVHALVQAELDGVNARFAPATRARALAVLDHEFTVEDGTLTPSQKVRRGAVETRYAAVIEALY
ncbi:AMP-dependent synthetase/ligase [Kitasatospora sp. NPDC056327]|uniref:AMP-dependent synthetase/ligase n=1 Tax=Kitasatospora sp. NPDC056327 TaxID=3345785 RepID=UPI0035E1847F